MEGGFVVFAARASRVRAHQGSWQSCHRAFALEGRVGEWEGPRSGASRPARREGASSVEARAHGRHREAHRLLGCSAKCSEGQSASFCFQFQGELICGPRSQEPLVPVLKKTQARTEMSVLPRPPVRAVRLRAPGTRKCSCRCPSLTLLYPPTPPGMVTVRESGHLLAEGDGVVGQAQGPDRWWCGHPEVDDSPRARLGLTCAGCRWPLRTNGKWPTARPGQDGLLPRGPLRDQWL